MADRVGFYVDGFNLYCGIRDAYKGRYKWLDLGKLCESIIRGDQEIGVIHYCSAIVKGNQSKAKRQGAYLDALESVEHLQVHLGFHQRNSRVCPKCQFVSQRHEEKQTDSRIAALMVADAMSDRVDTLILIGGDSDHVPAIEIVRKECPDKDLLVCLPPKRNSLHLVAASQKARYVLSKSKIRQSQFPDTFTSSEGQVITKPREWA